jgi:hypothetical protein
MPNLVKTKTSLVFTAVEPTVGNWLLVALICFASIPLSWYTTRELNLSIISIIFYWTLAYTMIDDKFVTSIDKEKNLVKVSNLYQP